MILLVDYSKTVLKICTLLEGCDVTSDITALVSNPKTHFLNKGLKLVDSRIQQKVVVATSKGIT